MTQKKALVLGATGLVGSSCLRNLLESSDYGEVRMLARRSLGIKHPKLREYVTDLTNLDDYRDVFSGTHVYCCLGTTLKKAGSRQAFRAVDYDLVVKAAEVAAEEGVERFLVISAINASQRSPVFYSRVKGQMEQAVKDKAIPFIAFIKPSLLRGERGEKRLGEDLGNRLSRILDPAVQWTRASWLPIDAGVVAKGMVGLGLLGPKTGRYNARYRDLYNYADQFDRRVLTQSDSNESTCN